MAAAVGEIGLVGWIRDVAPLTTLIVGAPRLLPVDAAALLVGGLALALVATGADQTGERRRPVDSARRLAGRIAGGAVGLVGLATLLEYAFGRRLGIDGLNVRAGSPLDITRYPGRLSPQDGLLLLLLGGALATIDLRSPTGGRPARLPALIAVAVATIALVGYAYHVESLYRVRRYPGIALSGAIACFVLGVGVLLARADSGFMAIAAADSAGGRLIRVVGPPAVLLPIVLSATSGMESGLRAELEEAVGALAAVLGVAAVIWLGARRLHRADVERESARREIVGIVEATPAGIMTVTADGRVATANGEAARLFGYEPGGLVGIDVNQLVPARFRAGHGERIAGFFDAPSVRAPGTGHLHLGLRRDGREVLLDIGFRPVETEGGIVTVVALQDMTERTRQAEERERRAAELASLNEQLAQSLRREKAAAKELIAIGEVKDTFLRALSHDLRSPLASIRAYTEIVGTHPDLSEARTVAAVERIADQARRLERLMSDLLDLDRLSTRNAVARRVTLDVGALVRRVVDDLDLPDSPVTVQGSVTASVDPVLVERIVANLVLNATAHTRPATEIVVSITAQDNGVGLAVDDAGEGVPDRLKARIFELFQRGDSAGADGLGIGLHLVDRFAALHGGRAWVEDSPLGGASFRVVLPAVRTEGVGGEEAPRVSG